MNILNGTIPETRPLEAFNYSEILSIVAFVGQRWMSSSG